MQFHSDYSTRKNMYFSCKVHIKEFCSYSTFSTKGIVEVKSSDPPFKNLTHFKIKNDI